MKRPTPTELDTLEWTIGKQIGLVAINTRDKRRLESMAADGLLERMTADGSYVPTRRGTVALTAGRLTKSQCVVLHRCVLAHKCGRELATVRGLGPKMQDRLRSIGLLADEYVPRLTERGFAVAAMLDEWEAAL